MYKLIKPFSAPLLCLTAALFTGTVLAQPATLVGDTHNRAGSAANNNYGTNGRLFTYDPNVANERTTLIQFAMPALTGPFASATLSVSVQTVADPGTLEVRRLLGPWDEGSVTYNTQPAVGAMVDGVRAITAADVGMTITIDVTAAVQGWYADPATNFGFILVGTDGLRARYSSSNGSSTPTLDVQSEDPEVGQVLAWNGTSFVATPPATVVDNSNADKMPPYQALNYIIALTGTFPSRSGTIPSSRGCAVRRELRPQRLGVL